jgi:IclR family transcriptional regulator, acetate operon repressor
MRKTGYPGFVAKDSPVTVRSRKKGTRETPSIQSLDRGVIILEAVGRSGNPVSLTELTDLLGIDRSSAFRLANTLKRRGFLANPSGRKDYILGPSIWRLSRRYDWSKMLIAVSHEHLKSLAARTMETAHLAVKEGKQALFIDHAAVTHMIAVSGQTGELVPLYCTAHGKALLADLGKRELEALFGAAPLRAYTAQTIGSIDRLARSCAEINARGFATDDAEFQEGIRCVASPIRGRDGVIVGSIGISAPQTRFPKERYPECAAQVVEVAQAISEILGAQS